MKAALIKRQLKKMYDVADVPTSYKYWFYKLLGLTLTMFDYEGLPESLPAREIELQLQLTNHCVTFMKKGKIWTTETSLFEPDEYYQPRRFTYAQPVLGSGTKNLSDADVCIIYNNVLKDTIHGIDVDASLLTFISHYARQLADLSSTINIYTVNSRLTDYPIGKTDSVRQSIQNFFNQLAVGKRSIISDDDIILNGFATAAAGTKRTADTLKDYIQCKDVILEQFFRDIGVKFRHPKAAQMSEEEVESDEQVLLISLDDMLKSRQEGIKRFNETYGLDVSVKINPKFDRPSTIQEVTGNERDNINNNTVG